MRANCNSSVTPLMAKASPARSPARSLRSTERSRRALQPEPAVRPPTVLEVVDEHPDREVELPGVGRIDANAAGAADVEQRFVVNGRRMPRRRLGRAVLPHAHAYRRGWARADRLPAVQYFAPGEKVR